MQKHVNLVDLVKSFPTNIFLQNLASIQKRTSPIKFAHLAEKSENGSISNLSTKAPTGACSGPPAKSPSRRGRSERRRSLGSPGRRRSPWTRSGGPRRRQHLAPSRGSAYGSRAD